MNSGEAGRREQLGQLPERRSREVGAVVGVHAAVVAVGLDPVDAVVVDERLRTAGTDNGDLLDLGPLAVADLRETLDYTRKALGLHGLDQVVERLDGEGVHRIAL